MLTPPFLTGKFAAGLPYEAYLATATPDQQLRWAKSQATLTDAQRRLIVGFARRVNILVISGAWCGDCASQCPMLAAIAGANPAAIHLRFLDREAHLDLANQVRICGGLRVPTVIFMNEDCEFVSLMGDKSLARLRAVAAKRLGSACELPGAPAGESEAAQTLQDWLNEVERVHLLVRLSPKLRERHGD
jgi:thioredoxin-like negative regulator of GroEL